MTAPRIPLFQRKGAPPAMSSAPPGPAIGGPPGGPPETSEGADPTTVQCQSCGSTIDTKTGAVVAPPPDAGAGGPPGGDAGGDVGAKLQAMMGAGS